MSILYTYGAISLLSHHNQYATAAQDYYDSSSVGLSYKDELYKFVDDEMDDDVFVDAVSNIVTRGCHVNHNHNYPCPASTRTAVETDRFIYGLKKRMNFNILKLVFELPITAPGVGVTSPKGQPLISLSSQLLPILRTKES